MLVLSAIAADPVGLSVAFAAGMLSFLSPCVLPLVPGYISMVSGLTAAELGRSAVRGGPVDGAVDDQTGQLSRLLWGIGGFVGGFTLVFTCLGAAATGVGQVLASYHEALDRIAGIVIIALGLWMIGVGTPTAFLRERRFHPLPSRLGRWAPPVVGMAFAFGWTPCIGPVLGGVLGLASTRATLVSGASLLVAYSLGLGVPFFITGLAFGRLTATLARVRRRLQLLNVLAGIALLCFGLLLALGRLHWLAGIVTSLLDDIGLSRLTRS